MTATVVPGPQRYTPLIGIDRLPGVPPGAGYRRDGLAPALGLCPPPNGGAPRSTRLVYIDFCAKEIFTERVDHWSTGSEQHPGQMEIDKDNNYYMHARHISITLVHQDLQVRGSPQTPRIRVAVVNVSPVVPIQFGGTRRAVAYCL